MTDATRDYPHLNDAASALIVDFHVNLTPLD
jgi:hypothetical protein